MAAAAAEAAEGAVESNGSGGGFAFWFDLDKQE
jgi:hypothetical protein